MRVSGRQLQLAWALAAALSGSCSGDRVRWLPSADVATIVLIQEVAGSPRYQAEILPIDAEPRLREVAAGPRVVFALAYAHPLSPREGRLSLSEEGVALPLPSRTMRLVAAQGAGTEWVQLDAPPEDIRALRFAELSPCIDFRSEEASVPGTWNVAPTILLPINENEALLGTERGQFFRLQFVDVANETTLQVTDETQRASTTLTSSSPHFAGAIAPDGEMWLFDGGRGVIRGTPDAGFRPGPPRTLDHWGRLELAASPTPPFELFALTNLRGVEHFDGTHWKTLRAPTATTIESSDLGLSIAWLEPGLAVLTDLRDHNSELLVIDSSGRTSPPEIRPVAPGGYHFHAVGYSPYLAPDHRGLAGLSNGVLFRRDQSAWAEVKGHRPIGTRTQNIIPVAGGALIGGRFRVYSQWTPLRDCPTYELRSGHSTYDARLVAQVGRRIVTAALGGHKESEVKGDIGIAWLTAP